MLIEYGVGIPLIILIVISFTDVARLFWTIDDAYRVINETARHGAICGETGYPCNDLVNYANAIDLPLDSVTYTAVRTTCGIQPEGYSQTGTLVTATINFTFLSPFKFFPNPPAQQKFWTLSTCYSNSL